MIQNSFKYSAVRMKISCIPEIAEDSAKLFNVIVLGTCFCLVFTGFNTMSQTQECSIKFLNEFRKVGLGSCVQLRSKFNYFKQSYSVPSQWDDNVS